MSKIMLLDGNSLTYRAFHAMPLLKNKKALYTNAVYGFALMLEKLLADVKPDFALVAFDKGKATFRHQTYSDYKGTRDKTPSELVEQFDYVRELLDSYGIKYEEDAEYEADDIIGTYAKKSQALGHDVIVVSGDKDLTQLASDKITIYYTKRGVTELDYYTPAFINKKYGLSPLQIIDMKGLMGDKSDNIPGIEGIGEKTAIKLLSEYGSLEEVLNNIDKINGKKLKERLENGKDSAILSKKLATIYTQVPIKREISDLTFTEDIDKKTNLYKKLEFSSFLKKLEKPPAKKEEVNLKIIYSDAKTDLNLKNSAIHLECYTDDYHNSDVLSLAVYSDNSIYLFAKEDFFTNKNVVSYLSSEESKNIFDFKKVAYHAKFYGIEIRGTIFDARIASYLVDVTLAGKLDKIVNHYLGKILESDEEIYGKGVKRSVPPKEIFENYLAKIVRYNFELKPVLENLLNEQNMLSLYHDIEIPTSKVLADMEFEGIHVNKKELELISYDLDKRTEDLEYSIYALAGSEFNISSPKQLGMVLFENLGLPAVKKTKTGYSTSIEVLEFLENKHPIVPLIMEYRTITKLNSTYAKGLIKDISREGKIHTIYEQTLAQTGRLSSINPNLQNIPIRIEDGKKIRRAFVPSSADNLILAIDYSQIELRVLAHIANDKVMIEAFNNDEDIHTKTASQVNNVALEEVTENMRREAKAVNFGIVYGISDFGLSNNLGISRKRAKEFIEKYLETFSGVKNYMDEIVQFAKENNYVETLFSRRRYLPEINNKNKMIVNLNSRIAMNTPIQGSAADIIKIAMVKVANYLKESKLRAKLLLQVHDELIFDVHKDDREELEKIVKELMESSANMQVKLKADASYGNNWYEAK
ncbi:MULTISPECIES: DNA polymerase I [unclassified Gemella]|uniref:DNA polymerase I n=1 Tax=unclassified Gemella TaxID=2624949 RepID=UPI001C04F889|nr:MULTISPECIES: DNA polymerase I [unclassified Gemella]MBU0278945.1 DNA polymerase I [Gemella sp. zg-1178]QWQ39054.1 DNA polymerase I [Gemella sp. zg-570]